ncbi:calcium/calmodulin-dependent protein kinase kinase 1 [Lepeophtheirus salmonis]|uniref:calcium/calmodulin-dependent protein kinase kinase 1 n=1 Tax=Lepeophtheirus salmonis TaxID=72036 RepID=UPI003AF33FAF
MSESSTLFNTASKTASVNKLARVRSALKKQFYDGSSNQIANKQSVSTSSSAFRRPKLGDISRLKAIDNEDLPSSLLFSDDNNLIMSSSTKGDSNASSNSSSPKASFTSNFVSVIEGTKNLGLNSGEKQRTDSLTSSSNDSQDQEQQLQDIESSDEDKLVKMNPGSVPLPSKCSTQLKKLIRDYSFKSASSGRGSIDSAMSSNNPSNECELPIFPNLPFSPYGSPNASPRIRRKPLRETKRVNSISEDNGEYVQLNQYKLEQNLGQGSYGIVKLVHNKEDDNHYALKIVSKKKLRRKAGLFGKLQETPPVYQKRKTASGAIRKQSESPIQKVYREIATMKKLDHPNVTKLVEVLDDPEDENMYMVFELLERGEILEVPTDSPLTEEQAWLAFRDITLGLEYLHYQKIIHRDIKPSNLLRADNGSIKIADLGVCNEFDGHDAFLTNTAGTPAFTPPESLSHKPGDEPFSGKAADIWSMGVTLYSIVYGKVPFHDENILALYNKIRTQPLVFDEDSDISISEELKDIIKRMLVKDPNERITLQELKQHDWVTGYGIYPLLTEEENCVLVEVTDSEVKNSIHTVPKLDTLILVKSMLKNHSFSNPFNSLRARFQSEGRSNSAPGAYDIYLNSTGTTDPSLPKLEEKDKEED